MNRPPRRRDVLAALAVLLPLHSHALMAGASPDSPTARVDANTASSPWTSAVAVIVNGNTFSGVVIAPRYVLTAAHVVGASLPDAVQVQINLGNTPLRLSTTAVQRFATASFPYDDLALLTLAEPVPAEVTIPRLFTTVLTGPRTATWVGYGASGNGNAGPTVSPQASVKRVGANRIDQLTDSVDASGRRSSFYFFDFDGSTVSDGNGAMGGPTLGNASETGLASGDSGSPVYVDVDGQPWLYGINVFTALSGPTGTPDFRFGSVNGGMVLSDPRFVQWLQTQTNNTLGPPPNVDVPLPLWSMAALGVALLACTSALWPWRWRQASR